MNGEIYEVWRDVRIKAIEKNPAMARKHFWMVPPATLAEYVAEMRPARRAQVIKESLLASIASGWEKDFLIRGRWQADINGRVVMFVWRDCDAQLDVLVMLEGDKKATCSLMLNECGVTPDAVYQHLMTEDEAAEQAAQFAIRFASMPMDEFNAMEPAATASMEG